MENILGPRNAQEAPQSLEELTREAEEVYRSSAKTQSDLDATLHAVADEIGAEALSGGQKSVQSMVGKVTRKRAAGSDYGLLDMKDHARGALVLQDFSQIPDALNALRARGIQVNVEAVKPTDWGYRGLHLTWRDAQGLSSEVQITRQDVWRVKKASDEIYEKWRNVTNAHTLPIKEQIERYKDLLRSRRMWRRLDLPDFSIYAASSSLDNTLAFQISSPETGREGSVQTPSMSSRTPRPLAMGEMSSIRPDSVIMRSIFINSAPSETNVPQSAADVKGETRGGGVNNAAGAGAVMGSSGTAYTDGNKAVNFKYAVVPASSLITSNDVFGSVNPAYPAEFQPRDRSRTASQVQMSNMVNNLNPALLMESPTAQNGAPIIRGDGVVIGGNARTSAIVQAYQTGKAQNYAAAVRDNAARFGIDPASLPENPVLVRIADTNDWAGLSQDLNTPTTSTYSATEQAQVDAEKIGEIINLLNPDDNGNINTPANGRFIQAFVESVATGAERNGLITPRGTLSQVGVRRLESAVFSYAYEDIDLVERLAESTDNDARNVTNALLATAANAATVNADIDAGDLYDFDITGRIIDAVNTYLEAKEKNFSVEELGEQTSAFGERNAVTMEIAQAIEDHKRSGKQLQKIFSALYTSLRRFGSPKQSSIFGGNMAPTSADILRGAKEIYEQDTGNQLELGTGRYYGSQEIGQKQSRAATARPNAGEPDYSRRVEDIFGGLGGNAEGAGGTEYAGGVTGENTFFRNIGAAEAGFADSAYNRWVENAESLHPAGEAAARNPSLPTLNPEGEKTSKVGQTVMEAAQRCK